MTTPEIIAICAIVAGPTSAMLVSLEINRRRERKRQKTDLFLTLLTQRKKMRMNDEILDALNIIDVIFYNDKKIMDAKEKLWESQNSTLFDPKVYDMRFLNLLHEISKHLRYKEIKQTDHLTGFVNPNEVRQMTNN